MIKRFIGNFLTTVLFLGAFTTVAFADVLQEWVATYNGSGNTWDQTKKMGVDADGNIYVTGTSGGRTSDWLDLGNDIVTIKYSRAGEKLWEARYNNPNLADGAVAMTIDHNGNVYVLGYRQRHPWDVADFITIKYNSDGEELWNRIFLHPMGLNRISYPVGIGVDSNGNAYVAGTSPYAAGGTNSDIVVLKYDQEGTMQWMQVYDSPYNWTGHGGDDYASAMTVDTNGNVYIAGTFGVRYGSIATYDYGILKYNTDGMLQWMATYAGDGSEDRSVAIALDTNGNLYITGWSKIDGDHDYATVKYDSNGIQQWIAKYFTPGGGRDIPAAIAIDSGGDVYVIGYSGNPARYTTIKYDTDGNQQWAKEYKGLGSLGDSATAIVLGVDGSAYVTGYSHGEGTGYDFATLKYSSDGMEEWVRRHNGSGNVNDYANTLAIDKEGNVYVGGASYGIGTNLDYTVIKYSPAIEVTVGGALKAPNLAAVAPSKMGFGRTTPLTTLCKKEETRLIAEKTRFFS